jgi:hypothetical protein
MSRMSQYRVKNWSEYNRSLINRGNITLWFSEEMIHQWNDDHRTAKRGRPRIYRDQFILAMLTLRQLFSLPLRATQGLVEGICHQMTVNMTVPDYTTLSKRAGRLEVSLGHIDWNGARHVVIDSTGLKVYGEGERHCRTHGKSKRRTWRKFHVAIDRDSLEIISVDLTASNVHDSMRTKALLGPIEKIRSVTGDKGYDNKNAYDPIAARSASAIIPPRSGAGLNLKNPSPGGLLRNHNILANHSFGKDAWKYGSGYTKRSRVENAIGRYKRIIGPTLHSTKLENQKTEVRIAAQILNRMTQLGMPKSYKL